MSVHTSLSVEKPWMVNFKRAICHEGSPLRHSNEFCQSNPASWKAKDDYVTLDELPGIDGMCEVFEDWYSENSCGPAAESVENRLMEIIAGKQQCEDLSPELQEQIMQDAVQKRRPRSNSKKLPIQKLTQTHTDAATEQAVQGCKEAIKNDTAIKELGDLIKTNCDGFKAADVMMIKNYCDDGGDLFGIGTGKIFKTKKFWAVAAAGVVVGWRVWKATRKAARETAAAVDDTTKSLNLLRRAVKGFFKEGVETVKDIRDGFLYVYKQGKAVKDWAAKKRAARAAKKAAAKAAKAPAGTPPAAQPAQQSDGLTSAAPPVAPVPAASGSAQAPTGARGGVSSLPLPGMPSTTIPEVSVAGQPMANPPAAITADGRKPSRPIITPTPWPEAARGRSPTPSPPTPGGAEPREVFEVDVIYSQIVAALREMAASRKPTRRVKAMGYLKMWEGMAVEQRQFLADWSIRIWNGFSGEEKSFFRDDSARQPYGHRMSFIINYLIPQYLKENRLEMIVQQARRWWTTHACPKPAAAQAQEAPSTLSPRRDPSRGEGGYVSIAIPAPRLGFRDAAAESRPSWWTRTRGETLEATPASLARYGLAEPATVRARAMKYGPTGGIVGLVAVFGAPVVTTTVFGIDPRRNPGGFYAANLGALHFLNAAGGTMADILPQVRNVTGAVEMGNRLATSPSITRTAMRIFGRNILTVGGLAEGVPWAYLGYVAGNAGVGVFTDDPIAGAVGGGAGAIGLRLGLGIYLGKKGMQRFATTAVGRAAGPVGTVILASELSRGYQEGLKRRGLSDEKLVIRENVIEHLPWWSGLLGPSARTPMSMDDMPLLRSREEVGFDPREEMIRRRMDKARGAK